ncbi:putative reverse transcriptase domain-containing protein [Tanacetum coccineum]
MHDEFEMSMMGDVELLIMGLQIKQMKDGIFFNQSKYIKEMLNKFGLEDSKPTKMPMSTEIKLTKDDEADSVDSSKYRAVFGGHDAYPLPLDTAYRSSGTESDSKFSIFDFRANFFLPFFRANPTDYLSLVTASVSVMPLLTYLNLGLGELAHTKLTMELADRTVKYPNGIAENVLVRIGKFTFLVDFIILDMPEDIKVPLILGRPFLSTAHAKIDVYKRKIAL